MSYETFGHEFSPETGSQAEQENFGKTPGEDGNFMENKAMATAYRRAFDALSQERKQHQITDLMEECKKLQLSGSITPETLFARVLRSKIFNELALERNEQLGFYTSVGSKLDALGIDGFFELDLGGGDRAYVTLDGTNNSDKMSDEWKHVEADTAFLWPIHAKDEDNKAWLGDIQTIADKIVEILREKVKESGGVIRSLDQFELEESATMARQAELGRGKKARAIRALRSR